MGYFSRFPVIIDYTINGKRVNIVDLTRRVAINFNNSDSRSFIEHTVKDGETDIILADRMYDNPDDSWIILFANEIHDYHAQWALTQSRLHDYVYQKYDNPNAIHHYESLYSGAVVDEDHPEEDRVSITNYEYEVRENDKKRNIKIPTPEAAAQIKAEHKRLISR